MAKVRIKRTPQAKSMPEHSGNQTPPKDNTAHPFPGRYMGGNDPEIKINQTLQPTDREHATLEAEKGETVVTNLQGEGIPEFYKIAGKRHSQGGTPLNLPANSFIFSRDKNLAIKDPEILSMFGKKLKKGDKKGFTPADISMNFNLNKYREILANPFTDKLQRETAEKMIQNYNLKLGQLALVQESMKGFDGDLPAIAQGYLQHVGIDPAEFLNPQSAPTQEQIQQAAKWGLETFQGGGNTPAGKRKVRVKSMPKFIGGGSSMFDEKTGKRWDEMIPGMADLSGTDVSNQGVNPQGVNPNDYMETTLKQRRDWGQIGKKMIGPAMDFAAMIGRGMTEPKVNLEDFTHADQVFAVNQRPDHGVNPENKVGVEDPTNVKQEAQFTGTEFGFSRMGGTTGLPGYQDGGEPTTSSKPTAKQNIPKEGVFWDPEAEGYDESKVKAGHYIKKNGRWHKVTGYQKPKYEGDVDERLGTFGTDYGLLKKKFENPELRKAFYEQYKAEMSKAKPNLKTGLSQADIDAALAMDEEQVINTFLKKQAINLAINAKYGDLSEYDKKDLWDKNRNLANDMAKELGFDPLSKSEVAAFQGAYIGVNNLSKNEEYSDMFKDFMVTQVGRPDEQVAGVEAGSISQIDGWDGNTTSAEVMLPRESEMKLEELEDAAEEKTQEQAGVKHMGPGAPMEPAKFWTQDLVNLGFGLGELYGIDKAKPWQAPLQYREAVPALQDFRGTAARIGSAAGAGAQQAATFAGPQSFAATFANIQRGAVDPILKAQEAERMGNQDVLNKFELFNTGQFNQFARADQALDTMLYDKHIVANQQFKNAKTQARDKVRGLLNQAWTNRGMTQTMNSMRDDFAVDPVTGYTYEKDNYRRIEPSTGQGDSLYANYQKIMTENPGMDGETARKLAKDMAGIPEYPAGVNPAAYMYPGNMG